MTARSVAWPIPVNAREPCRLAERRVICAFDGRGRLPVRSSSRNQPAAVMGSIVCELDGPMPILNRSKADKNV